MHNSGGANVARRLPQERRLLAIAFHKMDFGFRLVGQRRGYHQAREIPPPSRDRPSDARPPPSGRSCRNRRYAGSKSAESWKRQSSLSCAAIAAGSRRTGRAAPIVSRETGMSESARVRSASSSGLRLGTVTPPGALALAADVADQQRECRRRNAIDPAGLANGPRPVRGKLLPDLVGEPRQRREAQIVGQLKSVVAAIGGDVGGLPVEVDRVFGIDLELFGDLR